MSVWGQQVCLHLQNPGEKNGSPAYREVAFSENGVTSQQTNVTLDARTAEILAGYHNLQPFESIAKGQFHSWSVNYFDSFGSSSVAAPSLEFTQPVNVNGIPFNVSRIKMWLTVDNQICLRVSGVTQCAPGWLLTNGHVTVDVSTTRASFAYASSLIRGKNITWNFRFDAPFSAETLTAVATADDLDLDAYNVDGERQALDLLPWKSIKAPVRVID